MPREKPDMTNVNNQQKVSTRIGTFLLKAMVRQKSKSEVKALSDKSTRAEAKSRSKAEARAQKLAKAEAKGRARAEAEVRARAKAEARAKVAEERRAYSEKIADVEERVRLAEQARAEAEERMLAERRERTKIQEKAETEARLREEAQAKARAEAKLKAEAKAGIEEEIKTRDYIATSKLIPKSTYKTEAERCHDEMKAKIRAKTEEKSESRSEQITKVKAKVAEVISKVKSQAEAEKRAKAKMKTRAKTEEKSESRSEQITTVKAKVAEVISKVKYQTETEKRAVEMTVRACEDAAYANESAFDDIIEKKQDLTAGSNQTGELSVTALGTAFDGLLQDGVSALHAEDIMQKELLWGSSEDSVQQSLERMRQHHADYMMVGQDGALEGIISQSDLTGAVSPYLRPAFAKWRRPLDDATLQIKIKWIMSRPVHTITPQTSLATIVTNMCRFRVRCLPVVDQQGKVQGLVAKADIFRALLKNSPDASVSHQMNPQQYESKNSPTPSTETAEELSSTLAMS